VKRYVDRLICEGRQSKRCNAHGEHSASSARVSYRNSLGDTFGHRIERIIAVSHLPSCTVLVELIDAFTKEPDPAVRKLLALASLRVCAALEERLPSDLLNPMREALSWRLPD